MKIILLDTTYPVNSRTLRFYKTLRTVLDAKIVAWNRTGRKVKAESYEYILTSNTQYGNRLKKLLSLPLFFLFVRKLLNKERPQYVFASHWDSLFIAALIKFLTRKKFKLIYDCLDLPTTNNRFIHFVLQRTEKLCLKQVDLVIVASRYFNEFYSGNKVLIYENYPSKEIINKSTKSDSELELAIPIKIANRKVLSWIGVVRYQDILINILLALQGLDCVFYVFGDGPKLNFLKKKVDILGLNERVFFFGRYEMSDLPFIYSASDLVWAAYPTKDFNAVYAISNKYFECSYYNKLPILSSKTKMVENNSSKFIVDVNEYDVSDIVKKLKKGFDKATEGFQKYEPDVFWEDRESIILEAIRRL